MLELTVPFSYLKYGSTQKFAIALIEKGFGFEIRNDTEKFTIHCDQYELPMLQKIIKKWMNID